MVKKKYRENFFQSSKRRDYTSAIQKNAASGNNLKWSPSPQANYIWKSVQQSDQSRTWISDCIIHNTAISAFRPEFSLSSQAFKNANICCRINGLQFSMYKKSWVKTLVFLPKNVVS